jgi:hypothetical protein
MLSHVRALKTVAGKSRVRNLCIEDLEQLDNSICNIVNELTNKSLPDTNTAYHKTAIWAGAANREFPVQFFTTNYDLLFEQALEDCGVPYFDGFIGSRQAFLDVHAMEEDKISARWARLWKLHGSINWYQNETRVFRSMTIDSGFRRVIHPSHLKYEESRRMPYFAMFDRLRSFLRQPNATIVVIGFSFRDNHLNHEIVNGLQSNPTAAAFALLYGPLSDYAHVTKMATLRPNLTVLAEDGGAVGGQRGKFMEAQDDVRDRSFGEWLESKKASQTDDDGPYITSLYLGDFAKFGNFLLELVGREVLNTEVESAK